MSKRGRRQGRPRGKPAKTRVRGLRSPEDSPRNLDVFMLFDRDLKCTGISLAGQKLADVPESVVLGKNLNEISPDVAASGRYGKYLDVIRTGEPYIADDVVTQTEYGEVHFSAKAFKVGSGLSILFSEITELERTREALLHSQAAYQEIVENAQDIVFQVAPDGILTSLNPAFDAATGWSRRYWLGRPFASRVHPDDLGRAAGLFGSLLEGKKPPPFELRIRSKSGKYLAMELSMSPQLQDGMVVGALGIARDVTGRKRDEEQSKIRDSAIASSINAIIIADPKGRMQYVNPAFVEMWGYGDAGEVLEKNALDFWHDRKQARRIIGELFEKGRYRGELAGVRKDRSAFCVQLSASLVRDDKGKPICMMASFIDTTEQKEAEEALRSGERYYRALIESSLDGIVILDPDGTFRYQSPSMVNLFGYTPQDQVGRSMLEHVHPDDIRKAGDAFAKLVQKPGSMIHAQARGRHKDGSWRTLEITGRNLVDDPVVQGIVANFRDVTEREQAERALRESEEKFRRLVEDMNDGYCVLQKSRVVFANARSARMFGYGQQEVVGKTVEELLPPHIVAELAQMRAKRKRGEGAPVQYETTLVGKDGKSCPVELGTRVTSFDGKPALSVVIRDISERKQVEDALRASEEHYSALVENLADGVFKIKDGIVTWCNGVAAELYGYSKEDLIGKEATFFYPEGRTVEEHTREVRAAIREKNVFRGAQQFRTRSGELRWMESNVSQIPDRFPAELIAIVRDVTERKRMEEALRESEEQYSALLGNVADAVFKYQDGVMTWANDRIEEILGYTGEELIGRDADLFVSDDTDLNEVIKSVDEGIQKHGHFHGVIRARHKAGNLVDIEYTASRIPGKRPVEIVGVARDVTDRNLMERALRQSERNYRVLFESRMDGVFVVDADTMKIVLANQIAASMYGFDSPADVVGLTLLDLVHPADRERAFKSLVKDLLQKNRQRMEEFRSITRDGRNFWISTIGTKMEFGGKTAALISVRDITERKQAEQEKQTLEQQLQLSGRLAAVGELAAGVAHELNNPLAAVQAFAQFLSSRNDLDESTRRDVEVIYREAQRASRITGNLLSFARRHKPEKTLVCINNVVEKSLELHAYRMRVNNIEVELDLAPDLPETMADFYQVQQAFVNIVTNAEHAMTEAHGRGRLKVKTRTKGDLIQVTFTDDGPGISDKDLKRVFDPFYTTKEVGKGTGLGLSICYGIIQEHGGNLFARSKRGQGAAFIVEIPVTTDEQVQDDNERTNSMRA